MPKAPGFARRAQGPWIVVEVPMDDEDPLYPSRRRFYAPKESDGSTEHVDQAHRFDQAKDALHMANRIMHLSRGTWAEPMHLSMAWALAHSGGAKWKAKVKPRGAR